MAGARLFREAVAHLLEVGEVPGRRERGENAYGFLARVGEGVRHTDRYDDVSSFAGPDRLGPHRELELALEDVEPLLVRVMDVQGRSRQVGCGLRFREPQRPPCARAIFFHEHAGGSEGNRASLTFS